MFKKINGVYGVFSLVLAQSVTTGYAMDRGMLATQLMRDTNEAVQRGVTRNKEGIFSNIRDDSYEEVLFKKLLLQVQNGTLKKLALYTAADAYKKGWQYNAPTWSNPQRGTLQGLLEQEKKQRLQSLDLNKAISLPVAQDTEATRIQFLDSTQKWHLLNYNDVIQNTDIPTKINRLISKGWAWSPEKGWHNPKDRITKDDYARAVDAINKTYLTSAFYGKADPKQAELKKNLDAAQDTLNTLNNAFEDTSLESDWEMVGK